MDNSTPGSVGDYAASIGTTGYDEKVIVNINSVDVTIPPTGAFIRWPDSLRATDFTDGLSHTLLVGEKFIPRGQELTYPYDCNLYDGHNIICSTRSAGPGFPIAQARDDPRVLFGGPHPGICMFAFADG